MNQLVLFSLNDNKNYSRLKKNMAAGLALNHYFEQCSSDKIKSILFERPSVAGHVLQKALSFIQYNSVIFLLKIFTTKPLKLGSRE